MSACFYKLRFFLIHSDVLNKLNWWLMNQLNFDDPNRQQKIDLDEIFQISFEMVLRHWQRWKIMLKPICSRDETQMTLDGLSIFIALTHLRHNWLLIGNQLKSNLSVTLPLCPVCQKHLQVLTMNLQFEIDVKSIRRTNCFEMNICRNFIFK